MPHIHTLKFLPSREAINSISAFNDLLQNENVDFETLLIELKKSVFTNNFMIEQDNWQWLVTRGIDYFENSKLFAQAPLTYVCAFISEIFKNFEVEEINRRLPQAVLHQALARLAFFNR